MSMLAAGAYLWKVREGRRISRAVVAAHIRNRTSEGTNDVQVMRIEKGQPTNAAVLAAFVEAVQASADHVSRLLLDREADEDLAAQFAAEWLSHDAGTPDEQEDRRRRAIQLIDELMADPRKIDRLLGYADRLREE